jgi:hypothetical protein
MTTRRMNVVVCGSNYGRAYLDAVEIAPQDFVLPVWLHGAARSPNSWHSRGAFPFSDQSRNCRTTSIWFARLWAGMRRMLCSSYFIGAFPFCANTHSGLLFSPMLFGSRLLAAFRFISTVILPICPRLEILFGKPAGGVKRRNQFSSPPC